MSDSEGLVSDDVANADSAANADGVVEQSMSTGRLLSWVSTVDHKKNRNPLYLHSRFLSCRWRFGGVVDQGAVVVSKQHVFVTRPFNQMFTMHGTPWCFL